MSLTDRLKEIIAQEGPLSVADYVTLCLHDPQDGYYARHVRIGEDGDFITAPMVSQMFGELIGLWCVQTWMDMGSPEQVSLVEIGPGDGTLMSDILRAGRSVPGFVAAAQVTLIEPSRPLRALQSKTLSGHDFSYVDHIDALSGRGPVILIANELLDCLPANQYVREGDEVFERRIGLDEAGTLAFGLVPTRTAIPDRLEAGQLYEHSPAQIRLAEQIAQTLKRTTGVALLIDYGRDVPGPGDTLQALYRHKKTAPLEAPGVHDLTQWADFPTVSVVARTAGIGVSGITTQGDFLKRIGIGARLSSLTAKNPDRAEILERQAHRLVDDEAMGRLFKVLGLAFPPDLPLSGLDVDTTAR